MKSGPTLGVRGSIETLPDIRFAFDGPGALDSYAFTNALAYDVGAGLYVADTSPGWGLGAYAFVVGGIGRITSDLGDGSRNFAEGGGGVQTGPFGFEISAKFGWNRMSDPVEHTLPDRSHQHARDAELLMTTRPDSRLEAWLAAACADAERRGLDELKPLLESLAKSTTALRDADAQLDALEQRCSRQQPTSQDRRVMTADLRPIVEIAPWCDPEPCPPSISSRAASLGSTRDQRSTPSSRGSTTARLPTPKNGNERSAPGTIAGRLHGIPVSVKDLIDVAGVKTTSGSALPAAAAADDAAVIVRLREAGAIIIGKTNLHEFAFGTTSEETAFGPVTNPFDVSRSAGGSSGGAAAALATGMCFGALGTDTGGSIRIPSAACGTVGLKATGGELSCRGVVPLSTSLDHVGPMARSVADVAVLFDALAGPAPVATRSDAKANAARLRRSSSHISATSWSPGTPEALENACAALRAAGHTVRDVEIAHAAWTADVYLHIVLPEASQYHAQLLDRYAALYSPGVRIRLEMGRYLLAEDYVRAQRLRERLRHDVDRALDGCDALLLPTLPIPAPTLGATTVDINGRAEPVRGTMLRLTQLFNITGHPALALPAAQTVDPLPRSVQIVGRRHETRNSSRSAPPSSDRCCNRVAELC